MDRQAPVSVNGDRLLAGFQADSFSDTWSQSDLDFTEGARSQILLASIDTGQAPPAASAMRLEPLVEPTEVFDAAE